MTVAQQHTQNFTAAKLARLERLCGRFPVLSSENRQDYEELLISLLEAYWPRNFLGERLIKYLADEEWEVGRYKRHKFSIAPIPGALGISSRPGEGHQGE